MDRTNPASSAPIESPKHQQRRTLADHEVRAVIAAAAEVRDLARLAFRLGAEMGATGLQCLKGATLRIHSIL